MTYLYIYLCIAAIQFLLFYLMFSIKSVFFNNLKRIFLLSLLYPLQMIFYPKLLYKHSMEAMLNNFLKTPKYMVIQEGKPILKIYREEDKHLLQNFNDDDTMKIVSTTSRRGTGAPRFWISKNDLNTSINCSYHGVLKLSGLLWTWIRH